MSKFMMIVMIFLSGKLVHASGIHCKLYNHTHYTLEEGGPMGPVKLRLENYRCVGETIDANSGVIQTRLFLRPSARHLIWANVPVNKVDGVGSALARHDDFRCRCQYVD